MINENELVSLVIERFGTRDVNTIVRRAGLSVSTSSWHPVTAGEYVKSQREIKVNARSEIPAERIMAHEMGHYFLDDYGLKVPDPEGFCDRFADALLSYR